MAWPRPIAGKGQRQDAIQRPPPPPLRAPQSGPTAGGRGRANLTGQGRLLTREPPPS